MLSHQFELDLNSLDTELSIPGCHYWVPKEPWWSFKVNQTEISNHISIGSTIVSVACYKVVLLAMTDHFHSSSLISSRSRSELDCSYSGFSDWTSMSGNHGLKCLINLNVLLFDRPYLQYTYTSIFIDYMEYLRIPTTPTSASNNNRRWEAQARCVGCGVMAKPQIMPGRNRCHHVTFAHMCETYIRPSCTWYKHYMRACDVIRFDQYECR